MSHGIPNLVDEMLRYPEELRRAYAILASREQPVALTPRQADLLDFIRQHREEHGVIPTYRQMASAIGAASLATVFRLVKGAEKRGALTRTPDAQRSIVIVEGRS